MGLFTPIDISASGLTAERLRLDLIANNLANAQTTRTPGGGPYRRQLPVFVPGGVAGDALLPGPVPVTVAASRLASWASGLGVAVVGIVEDPRPGPLRYDPANPDADAEGYVRLPNVDPTAEMVDLVAASRAYEANVQALSGARSVFQAALEIGRA
ncbi:MAG: flagellar basal body rod protein FlgC [Clostridia bacterium]|nr:flagellar basal body rod protein FlgC [Clostridia bacterium]